MEFFVDAFGILLIAVCGVLTGRFLSGLKKPYWIIGFLFPCLLIAVLAAARFSQTLYFISPVFWLTAGRSRFIVLSFAISAGLTIPLYHLPYKWEKQAAWVLMAVLVTWSAVLPFSYPALIKGKLAGIETRFDRDGICRQTTKYTCGPAAAVTALHKLGFSADEGEIAILSYASPVTGTLPSQLCSALQSRFGSKGLNFKYRKFDSIEQLKKAGLTLVVVKDAVMLDHCIVVLEVADNQVAIADPVTGKSLVSYKQFENMWRFSGIVIEHDSFQQI